MQVFKAVFKVIMKNKMPMLIYMFVFIFLVLLLTLFYHQTSPMEFNPQQARIALINEDAGDPVSDGLAGWLGEKATIVDVPDRDITLRDSLFYREISYILRIPDGFGEKFSKGDYAGGLIRTVVPDSYSGIQVDLLVERYLNIAALYLETGTVSTDGIAAAVRVDMEQEAEVIMETATGSSMPDRVTFYYLYLAYTIIAVMTLGVSTIMIAFNEKDLRRRNQSSPITLFNFNKQLVLGNLVFTVLFWLLMFLLSLVLADSRDPGKLFLLGLNSLVFCLTCLSLGFLISQFIRSKAAQQSIANVLALGTSFISGVFVPQELLGDTVKMIASFTPTYWYTRAVYEVSGLNGYSTDMLGNYTIDLLIQAGFAAALLAIALAVVKSRRQTRE